MKSKPIYLDYAAATPLDREVLALMRPYFTDNFYNPSATYLAAKAVAKGIEAARSRVAHWLGAKPSEIVFTAGGTEANNLAIRGVMSQYPEANIIVSAVEHESVLKSAADYPRKIVSAEPDGRIDIEDLQSKINDQTALISIIYANNEIGTIQPLKEIGEIIERTRKDRRRRGIELPLYLHTDACQAGNYLDLQAKRLGVDLMTLNGGKVYGPKQSGALFVKTGVNLKPLIAGGGQERGLRSGTENVAGLIGFSAALDKAQNLRHEEARRVEELRDEFMRQLNEKFPDCYINGSTKHRLANNVHVTFPGQDNERLMMMLDEAGIQCAAGSACSASNDEPSHVLEAIGFSENAARSSLRFTIGRQTTENDVIATVKTLGSVINS